MWESMQFDQHCLYVSIRGSSLTHAPEATARWTEKQPRHRAPQLRSQTQTYVPSFRARSKASNHSAHRKMGE